MTSLKIARAMFFSKILGYFTILLILLISVAVVHVSSEHLCEELPVIRNGQVILEDGQMLPFRVNDTLSYECDDYYKIVQRPPIVTCILNDTVTNWTEAVCKPVTITCHDPGFIANADRIGLMFTFPHSVKYVCHEGFRMRGIDTKYCSQTGRWQPQVTPYCEEILCPALGNPANGKVLHSNRRLDSIAVYECDRYYKLVGDSERECQINGTWSGSSPVCEKITCKAPGKFPNGRIIGKKDTVYNASDILIFRCNDEVTHATSKCLESGEWNHPPPVCPGSTTTTTTNPSTTIFITIGHKGSPTVDSTTIAIDQKGGEISCEDPGKIKNGDRDIIGLQVNSTVTYFCDEGYELRGKSTLLCLENGKWDLDKLPICVKPVSSVLIVVTGLAVILLTLLAVGGALWYRYKIKGTRGYGEKSKALTDDATDAEEIAGLDRDKKIPVTVL